jgi:FtsZ-binding cell division protein ZapB
LEIENLKKEKSSMSEEFSNVRCERDESKRLLIALENEVKVVKGF